MRNRNKDSPIRCGTAGAGIPIRNVKEEEIDVCD